MNETQTDRDRDRLPLRTLAPSLMALACWSSGCIIEIPVSLEGGGGETAGSEASGGGASGSETGGTTDGSTAESGWTTDVPTASGSGGESGGTTDGATATAESETTDGAIPNELAALGLNPHPVGLELGDALTFGDYDGDGDTDIATSILDDSSRMQLLLNEGSGQFFPGPVLGTLDLSPSIVDAVTGDFDGNGHLDVAIFQQGPAPSFRVLYNQGNLEFGTEQFISLLGNASSVETPVAALDANADGRDDLVVRVQNGSATVMVGAEQGLQEWAPIAPSACYLANLAIADLDGDGLDDIVGKSACENNLDSSALNVVLNDPPPFQGETLISGPEPLIERSQHHLADFDDDGILDIVAASVWGGLVVVDGLGQGQFSMQPNFIPHALPEAEYEVFRLDLGPTDLAFFLQDPSSFDELGAGVLIPDPNSLSVTSMLLSPLEVDGRARATQDLDGDGLRDLVVENSAGFTLWATGS